MIKLTFEFDSKQAFVDFVRALPDALPPSIVTGAAEVTPAVEAEKSARKPRTPKAAAPAQEPIKVDAPTTLPPVAAAPEPAAPAIEAPTQAPVEAATPATAPDAAAPTQGDAQRAVEKVFEAKGFQGAHTLLAQFGAQRLRELDASKYAEFIAYADKMVA